MSSDWPLLSDQDTSIPSRLSLVASRPPSLHESASAQDNVIEALAMSCGQVKKIRRIDINWT